MLSEQNKYILFYPVNYSAPNYTVGSEFKLSQNIIGEEDETYSNFTPRNELVYREEPSRANDGNVYPNEYDHWHAPTVEFEMDFLSEEVYSNLIKIINAPSFLIKYYDYELGKQVYRHMYMTNRSVGKYMLQLAQGLLSQLKISFTSCEVYENYDDLLKESQFNVSTGQMETIDS